jgi:GntR family transcriptional regulator/MocR family aminotransferase
MSLSRRLELLELARLSGAWIIEDDYDSEFRYRGSPIASLQGLDRFGCVIYMGTFSKTMFPGLRIGYIVAPVELAKSFEVGFCHTGQAVSKLIQVAVSEFRKVILLSMSGACVDCMKNARGSFYLSCANNSPTG